MKQMKRKFWILERHHANGFTLVELIVVIAILAILAGVGIPAYSGYITKANKTADQTLVNDIIRAVDIYNYANAFTTNVSDGIVGHVVITQDAIEAVDALRDKDGNPLTTTHLSNALAAAYGTDYANSLRLKYDGWTDTATLLNEAANNPYAGSINGSTYIIEVGTEKLLTDVQHCATSFSQFLNDFSNNDPAAAVETLTNIFGSEFTTMMSDAGYTADKYDEVTVDVLANATVFSVASNVKNDRDAIITGFADPTNGFLGKNLSVRDDLVSVANWYAAGEALVAYLGDDSEGGCSDIFSSINLSGDQLTIVTNMKSAYAAIQRKVVADQTKGGLYERYLAYYGLNLDQTPIAGLAKSQAQKDGEAYVGIMTTVNNLDDDYIKNPDAMTNANLFTEGGLMPRVNNFIAATSLTDILGGADADLLKQIAASGYKGSSVVLIFRVENGMLTYDLCPVEILE